jgi:hypothetical protein
MKQTMNQVKKNSSVRGKASKQKLAELVSVLNGFDFMEVINASCFHTSVFGHAGFLIKVKLSGEALGALPCFIKAACSPLEQPDLYHAHVWDRDVVGDSQMLLIEGFEGADPDKIANHLREYQHVWRIFMAGKVA